MQVVNSIQQQQRPTPDDLGLTEFFILIAVIIGSLLLLNITLIYGADYSQQWQPVMSNVDTHLALMEMYG